MVLVCNFKFVPSTKTMHFVNYESLQLGCIYMTQCSSKCHDLHLIFAVDISNKLSKNEFI